MMLDEADADEDRAVRCERRRQLRRRPTDAELLLWRLLRRKQLGGAKFRRQHQVEKYTLDFYCPAHKLAIEADGGQHMTAKGLAKDAIRTDYLKSRGISVLRFTNLQILTETEAVLET